MVNYQNGKIYKIINENNEIIYIGSTAEQHLSQRYTRHKHKAPNHKIILIENYSCNSREELRKREQQIIEEHSNLLNKCRAYTSEEDKIKKKTIWDKNNIEYLKQYRKNYYNKPNIKNHRKQYNNTQNIKNYRKQYYSKKIKCEYCNCEFCNGYIKDHQETLKCFLMFLDNC